MSRYDEFRDVLKGNVHLPGWKPSASAPKGGVGLKAYPHSFDGRDEWLFAPGAHTKQGYSAMHTGQDILAQKIIEDPDFPHLKNRDDVEEEWGGAWTEAAEVLAPKYRNESKTVNHRGPNLNHWEGKVADAYVHTGFEPTDLMGVQFDIATPTAPIRGRFDRGRGANYTNPRAGAFGSMKSPDARISARSRELVPGTMSHELGHHVDRKAGAALLDRDRAAGGSPIPNVRAQSGSLSRGEALADVVANEMVPAGYEGYRGGTEHRRSSQWRNGYEEARSFYSDRFPDLISTFRKNNRPLDL